MNYEETIIEVQGAVRKLEHEIGRKIVYAFLQGSQNYHLDTSSSDIDIKAFCLPSFDDLYSGERFSKTLDYSLGQITIHDLRMLPELWKKTNPTYLEGFFSLAKFQEVDTGIGPSLFNEIFFAYRSNILWSIYGTFLKKLEEMHHPSEIRKPVVERFGYDVKSASHALRLGYLFHDVFSFEGNQPFAFYAEALRLQGEKRDRVLSIKLGEVQESELLAPLQEMRESMEARLRTLSKEKIAVPEGIARLEMAIKARIKEEFSR